MDFNYIILKLKEGFTYPQIAKELDIPVTTLKSRCISKGIYATKIVKQANELKTSKKCPSCKLEKPFNQFYVSKGKMIYCKKCQTEKCTHRKRTFKKLCLEYKGNSCVKCGYNKCAQALHFHHLNPLEKHFHISSQKSYILTDKVKLELDKCILLCANCHAEIHS